MLSPLSQKQSAWVLSRQVVVDAITNKAVYYQARDYAVTFHLHKSIAKWTCTCIHGSLYPGGMEKKCKHILACEMRQEREGAITW